MNSLPIIALIGIAILVTSTVGFGATLSTTPTFNFIGASDNNIISAARANITALVWTEQVSALGVIETDEIIFAVGNEDFVNSHDYQICIVIEKQDATFLPAAGSPPNCIDTTLFLPSSNNTGQTIAITPMNITDIVDISFSIEEIR